MAETLVATELEDYIGLTGTLETASRGKVRWRIHVIIVDAKRAYGHLRFKVRQTDSPRGSASQWVKGSLMTLDADAV